MPRQSWGQQARDQGFLEAWPTLLANLEADGFTADRNVAKRVWNKAWKFCYTQTLDGFSNAMAEAGIE